MLKFEIIFPDFTSAGNTNSKLWKHAYIEKIHNKTSAEFTADNIRSIIGIIHTYIYASGRPREDDAGAEG
jgi:hypothetical protein